MKKMQKIWDEWIEVLDYNFPDNIQSINPGADEKQIQELELLISVKLPKDFADFYRIHNGQTLTGEVFNEGLIYTDELLSIERIKEEWKRWKDGYDNHFSGDTSEPEPGIKPNWWNPLWIPFSADGFGNHYCIDLDPAEKGKIGQVIKLVHDDGYRELMHSSFPKFIENCMDAFED